MVLTGNKDVDLYILSKLEDEDLFNICSLQYDNKYIYELCNNESFWRDRYYLKWGYEASNLKPTEDTWKKHYTKTLDYIEEWDKDFFVWIFFKHIYWNPKGIEYSFYVDTFFNRRVKLENAPNKILIPFYTLNIYKHLNPTLKDKYKNKYKNKLTPYTYLNVSSEKIDLNKDNDVGWITFLHGFIIGGYPIVVFQFVD
jgi:hypothetical protein